MFNLQQNAPLEEVEEMIFILKGMQRHLSEVYLLGQRAKAFCPQLTDTQTHNPLTQFLDYEVNGRYFPHTQSLKTHIEQLQERKRLLVEEKERKDD